jgi:hypothetical protein
MNGPFCVREEKLNSKLIVSLLKGVWIYSLILWLYIVVDNLIYNFAHQYDPLSNYVPIPEDLLALLAFAASFLCYLGWDYLGRK